MKVLLTIQEEKEFPLCPKEFPDDLFTEQMAQKNHGQSLSKLNDRGGLSPMEMMLNVLKTPYRIGIEMNTGSCIVVLCALKFSIDNEDEFLKIIK